MSSFNTLPSISHTLAASGDTILTLNNPNAQFAPWEGDSKQPSATSTQGSPVTFRVSSQHLIQASSMFKAALTGCWKEGSKTVDGFHEISAEDWDAEAMRIVLCLIHSRTMSIPRTVTLEMLAKIAVLVDYYGLREALHFCASLWIDHLRPSLPTTFGRDLTLWICVSWVFKDAAIFEAVTKLAIEHSPGKLSTLNLPIPEGVINRIHGRREIALWGISIALTELRLQLINGKAGCSFECSSLLLGALTKYMHAAGFTEDYTIKKLYEGRSLMDAIKQVREMKSPDRDWHRPVVYYNPCLFSLRALTQPFLDKTAGSITGLGLYDQ